jgi:hypothetical protein
MLVAQSRAGRRRGRSLSLGGWRVLEITNCECLNTLIDLSTPLKLTAAEGVGILRLSPAQPNAQSRPKTYHTNSQDRHAEDKPKRGCREAAYPPFG